MCGIVGYVGQQQGLEVVLDGLRRLEYRGYDSAGVAVLGPDGLAVERKAGKLANLEKALTDRVSDEIATGATAIGHTRWATHGGPTDRNAHPHQSADGRVAVIHNGIIENFAVLRAELEASGVEFASDTDTECVAHLLAAELTRIGSTTGGPALAEAMRRVCRRLKGAFTLLAVDRDTPGVVVAWRASTCTAPPAPSSMPASSASPARGPTPMPSTTRSAPIDSSGVWTSPLANPVTSVDVATRMPWRRSASASWAPRSPSSRPRGCSLRSTMVVVHPRSMNASAISRPM